MFGIKTKKDKKIEVLQREIDRLKTIISRNDVSTLYSEFVLPIEALGTITEKQIKSVLATKIVNELEENLEIEHSTDIYNGFKIYKAKLNVIKM